MIKIEGLEILFKNVETKSFNSLCFTGESGDSSLVVSLEINSVMYQGVLFAQPASLSKVKDRNSSSSSKEHKITRD